MDELINPQVNPEIQRMVDALTPEYLRGNKNVVDPNAEPGKIPAVEPMNFAPFMTADLVGNVAGVAPKGAMFLGSLARHAPLKDYEIVAKSLLGSKRVPPGTGTALPNIDDSVVRSLWGKYNIHPTATGQLAHEIRDTGMSIPVWKNNFSVYQGSLGKAVDHPELFENFPSLKDIKLEMYRKTLSDQPTGMYNALLKNMSIAAKDEQGAREALVHELQHAVDSLHKRPFGTANDIIARQIPDEAKALLTPSQRGDLPMLTHGRYMRDVGEVNANNSMNRMKEWKYLLPPWQTEGVPRSRQLVHDFWLNGAEPAGLKPQSETLRRSFERVPNIFDHPGTSWWSQYRIKGYPE